MPKVFTVPVLTCESCPDCIFAGSKYSGKLLSGAQAAKEAGVFVEEGTTSHAAFCRRSNVMLPSVKVTTTSWMTKTKTMPTFIIPAHCKLSEAGASPAPAPGAAMSREQMKVEAKRLIDLLANP
jgi:hypothetical protein